jgi:hypothetical protein
LFRFHVWFWSLIRFLVLAALACSAFSSAYRAARFLSFQTPANTL